MDIDVTELFADQDTGGAVFDVIRRPEVVNNFGEGEVPAPQLFPLQVGSVYPAAGDLIRQEALDAQASAITVVTTFRLRGVSVEAGVTYKPDLIVWPAGGQDRYIVRGLRDFSKYGSGFIEADCLSIRGEDTPPA